MRRFDVVVVGGGIHGVGVAQAVAAAGHSVLLLEKRALAAGTSSKSSKLIHGGLRYLESGQFRLVHESLQVEADRAIGAHHILHGAAAGGDDHRLAEPGNVAQQRDVGDDARRLGAKTYALVHPVARHLVRVHAQHHLIEDGARARQRWMIEADVALSRRIVERLAQEDAAQGAERDVSRRAAGGDDDHERRASVRTRGGREQPPGER